MNQGNDNGTIGALVTGDFNHDGKPDIVQCCMDGNLATIFGDGQGNFESPIESASAPRGIGALTTADLNNDGNLDIVGVIASDNPNLYIWLGKGDGTFDQPIVLPTTQLPYAVATGNFFGDGYLDIAVGEQNGNIDFFRNEGGNNFVFVKSINIGNGSGSSIDYMDAGNVNGNGVSTLAVAAGNSVWAIWADGKGNFTPVNLGSYYDPIVKVGNLAQDGRADILVGYTCNPQVPNPTPAGPDINACAGFDAFYGQGNNQLIKRTLVTDPGVYDPGVVGYQGVQIADVNGDGFADIIATSATAGWGNFGVFVWTANADGTFNQTPQQYILNTDGVGQIAEADFNRDGKMDFAVASQDATAYLLNASTSPAPSPSLINHTVVVYQPVDGTYSHSPVSIGAIATDSTPVTAMQEYEDGQLVYNEPVTQFSQSFPGGLGPHLFVTKVWDADGVSFRSDRNITVYSGNPGAVCHAAPSSASICVSPDPNVAGVMDVIGNGETPAVPTDTQLYINGSLRVDNQNHSSYIYYQENFPPGTYNLVFKLWDSNGNVYTSQKTITVQ